MIRKIKLLFCVFVVLVPAFPALSLAQVDKEVAISALVRIQCKFHDGTEMVSTGFSWNDRMHVVTALHAVAGCRSIEVKKEGGKKSLAKVESVMLEADLAYLQLANDIGLTPAKAADKEPNVRGDFRTWGYPRGILESTGAKAEFADGQRGVVAKLNSYKGVDQLEGLFETQDYPRRDTEVFRMTTVLGPGQSGAPILNNDGLVVAIANGGLMGGNSGLNWSMPAHIYLERLPYSRDEMPNERSSWAALFSLTKAGPSDASNSSAGVDEGYQCAYGELCYVNTIAFDLFAEYKSQLTDNDYFENELLQYHYDNPGYFDDVYFEIFEDTFTGTTIAIPAGVDVDVTWEGELGVLFASTPSGAYKMAVGSINFDSFYDAAEFGVPEFLSYFYDVAEWEVPPEVLPMELDPEIEWGTGHSVFRGIDRETGQPVLLNLYAVVLGNQVFARAFILPENDEDAPEEEYIASYMMFWSAQDISGFSEY